MNTIKPIKSALISVYNKDNVDIIVRKLAALGIKIYSTGGTFDYIQSLDVDATTVESLTSYPSIFAGRVKTLHPKIFGGILYRREEAEDVKQAVEYEIPPIDLVIVDLYPFEETVSSSAAEEDIIEKIDIGGISLIRAAAKNFNDVIIVPSSGQYNNLIKLLDDKNGSSDLDDRYYFAAQAFNISSHYDTAIFNYFNKKTGIKSFKQSINKSEILRYGENPHQEGVFYGDLTELFDQLNGKAISYNNLVDMEAALALINEFKDPTIAIIKHTNACGVASRPSLKQAWGAALEGDPVSAFGGVVAANRIVDLETAEEANKLFFEIIIAPGFENNALELLKSKKNRIILQIKPVDFQAKQFKSVLNGVIEQKKDTHTESIDDLKTVTRTQPDEQMVKDLLFANILVKHLKSNAIVLARNEQLLGAGCGMTSRVDALKHAIAKASQFGLDLHGSVMASDAFFPFADSVELAYNEGITAVIQPGGSVRDEDSIDFCNQHGLSMVFTGVRHFKH
ncbi:MAG: bifunctional phosphoribosylaminoimidazolecarboxamide formyltransferase/IMP cyclohydrolase [Bacteroidales bacterium]